MHADPAYPIILAVIFIILLIGILMKKIKQPYVTIYLLTGFLVGPHMLGLLENQELISRIGSFGVILLLFFIGMEVSPKRLSENWLISVVGTLLQVCISILCVTLIAPFFEWSLNQIILLGFVMSMSSTAIIIKLLEDWGETSTRVGQDVIGILLVQDILIAPILVCLSLMGEEGPSYQQLLLQGIGSIAVIAIVSWITVKESIQIQWLKYFREDHELQVFASLGICFGMALFTGLLGLSSALGAFVGGLIVGSAKETHWVQSKLLTIRTIFLALFFVSIGCMINVTFLEEHAWQLTFLVTITLASNTFINGFILKFLGEGWEVSLYGGSLLSQLGEFSFVVAATGYHLGIIQKSFFEMTITVIALTLFFSPFWISLIRHFMAITERRLKRLSHSSFRGSIS